jgi:hypothetical protein
MLAIFCSGREQNRCKTSVPMSGISPFISVFSAVAQGKTLVLANERRRHSNKLSRRPANGRGLPVSFASRNALLTSFVRLINSAFLFGLNENAFAQSEFERAEVARD